jgi:hypothetical protein
MTLSTNNTKAFNLKLAISFLIFAVIIVTILLEMIFYPVDLGLLIRTFLPLAVIALFFAFILGRFTNLTLGKITLLIGILVMIGGTIIGDHLEGYAFPFCVGLELCQATPIYPLAPYGLLLFMAGYSLAIIGWQSKDRQKGLAFLVIGNVVLLIIFSLIAIFANVII